MRVKFTDTNQQILPTMPLIYFVVSPSRQANTPRSRPISLGLSQELIPLLGLTLPTEGVLSVPKYLSGAGASCIPSLKDGIQKAPGYLMTVYYTFSHQEQFGVQCLAQGYFTMLTQGSGIKTSYH